MINNTEKIYVEAETFYMIKNLVELLNKASEKYYNDKKLILKNSEWDLLKEGLEDAEKATGIVLENSPTKRNRKEDEVVNGRQN